MSGVVEPEVEKNFRVLKTAFKLKGASLFYLGSIFSGSYTTDVSHCVYT